ncbi:Leucine binding and solute-binding domains-containing protein [Desulfonema magnum]|uniref:Leucine binding and solute-binding domains-containing protein n=1 Tax=Desulfonema magnum TaxID=45655 RepID=A0A975BLI5_9BACT|nr:Leucine binding and solute-binding domains-containing protein [Desulfonema magnum]
MSAIVLRCFFLFALLVVFSCDTGTPSEKRSDKAARARGDILIGVVRTSTYSNFFLEGVTMAVEEINQRGGLSGRKIKPVVYDDMEDADKGERIAAELAKNEDVVAVVGHRSSNVAIPASVIYEEAGICYLSYGATDPDLTRYRGNFTFRNIPTQKEFGYQVAEYAHRSEFKKVITFYERKAVHKSLAEIFKARAMELGIEIVATRSYFTEENDFRSVIALLKKEYEFDSVLIAGDTPTAAVLVSQLREMGANVPIMGGDGLDTSDLWVIAGKAAENIAVPTVFNALAPDKLTRDFVKRFESRYGFVPDTWAAQGYDAMSVLASAIEKGGSAVPIVISTTLRFLENWKGVTGSYDFTPEGDITGKKIFFKVMKDGEFVFTDQEQMYESDLFNYMEEYTLRLPLKRPVRTIDPGLGGDSVSAEITEQLFLGLTDFDPETYEAVPELAKKWRVSASGNTYIFDMRYDATWTNGDPVTAHDVAWAVRRNIHPDTKSSYAHMLYILKNAKPINKGEIKDVSELGVYSPDDFTVVFKLEHPASYFPALVSSEVYRPLPKAAIEKYGHGWTEPENIRTNGSYMLALWEKSRGMFLKKNPKYYDAEKVSVPEVRYYVIAQSSLGLAMYENNELDIMGSSYLRLPPAEVHRIKKNPVLRDQYSESPHFCTYTYAFNTRRPPVDNPLVRKAISAAIDRQLLIDAENEGNGEPATTCARPPGFGAVSPEEGVGIGFDPSQAQKWLALAGYPGGKGFPDITLLYNDSEFHKKIASAIQAILKHHLNINIKLQGEDDDNYTNLVTQGNPPHMFRAKMCSEYPDANGWLDRFHPSNPFFNVGWKNQEFATLIDKAGEKFDREQRKMFYKRAEQILCEEEAVAIPLYFEIYHCLVKPRVKGWYHMATGGQHIRNWYFGEE